MLPLLNVTSNNLGLRSDISGSAVLTELGWKPVVLDSGHVFGLQHPHRSHVQVPVCSLDRTLSLDEDSELVTTLRTQVKQLGWWERRKYVRLLNGSGWSGWPEIRVPCDLAHALLERSFDSKKLDASLAAYATLAMLRWGNNPGHMSDSARSSHFFDVVPFLTTIHVNSENVWVWNADMSLNPSAVVVAADTLMFSSVLSEKQMELLELIAFYPDPHIQMFAANHPSCPPRLRTLLHVTGITSE